ncbi:MAG: non-ribosomal peptide synthetase, partial [Ignavibacteriae bacterium]|nr:non-ribosomal peptide synthetase [Ignavibacteriota bacterium]
ETTVVNAEQGLVTGNFPYTPIQENFFNTEYINRNHWNQSVLFKINQKLNDCHLKETVKHLLNHHDALRIHMDNKSNNELTIANSLNILPYNYIDLSESKLDQKVQIESICSDAQESLNLGNGPIFKIIYIDLGENEGRILIVVHHIAIDGVSWRILLEDFQLIYKMLSENKEVHLPPKTTSFKEWASRLKVHSESDKIINDFEYWNILASSSKISFQVDEEGTNNEKSTVNEIISFDEITTKQLLQDVNKKYNTKINDILLAALLRSYSTWSGKRSLFIDLEGHGRENLFEDLDISRTIGWFTSIYPLFLDLKKSINIGESIKLVKEQIRKIPSGGISYGLLRYLSDNDNYSKNLQSLDDVGVTFNYLGQFDSILDENSIFKIASESKGNERSENDIRDSLIDITGSVGNSKLTIIFSYSSNLFDNASIKSWAMNYKKELEGIIKHCVEEQEKTHTSSDFELSNLNEQKLNKVLEKLKKK